mmetsp:Transcript_29206/g.82922  ORF Transcript_29206/g.82922 Transcript_29206/m.82922 type:complete len:211 (+) Transcript_29206:762-1394(+)
MSTSSCGCIAEATEEADSSKKGWMSAPLRMECDTSGTPTTSGDLKPVACVSFQCRSPKERLTRDSAPPGCRRRWPSPSPETLPPAKRIRMWSVSRMLWGPPQRKGAMLVRLEASHSVALHKPTTAVKMTSPMRSATAAPHPSFTSGWFDSSSWSRSSKAPTRAACTAASSGESAGSSASRFSNLRWKFRAQNSAAKGPGSPAQDWPSKSA